MSAFEGLPVLRNLAPRDRRAVLLGVAVLLPALLYAGAIRPYRSYLSNVVDQTAAERALLEREQRLLARADALPSAVNEAETEAMQAELRLVRAPNTPLAEAELTGYLESVATLSRVLLEDIRAVELRRNEAKPEAVQVIRLAVTGESDLEGVVTFLKRLESSPLLIRVREMLLEPVLDDAPPERGGGLPTGVMHFTLVVEAFTPPETALVAAPPATAPQSEPEVQQ